MSEPWRPRPEREGTAPAGAPSPARGAARFWADQSGAATVDWIALVVIVIALAIVSVQVIEDSSVQIGDTIEDSLESAQIGSLDFR